MERDISGPSEFYTACRNGDVEFVKNYFKTHSDTKNGFNNFEPIVNSTPLHAASYHGHKEIVQLLIEHECDRSRTNEYGLTAYEEAANDEIRQLFYRPTGLNGSRRFQEDNINECFDLFDEPEEFVSIHKDLRGNFQVFTSNTKESLFRLKKHLLLFLQHPLIDTRHHQFKLIQQRLQNSLKLVMQLHRSLCVNRYWEDLLLIYFIVMHLCHYKL